jgi:methionine biosynthesis protein MetW
MRDVNEQIWVHKMSTHKGGRGETPGRVTAALKAVPRREDLALLDIGCGVGDLLQSVPMRNKLGIDVSSGALQLARNRGCAVLQADVDHGLPCADASFDVVACLDVIEHVWDPHHLLAESRRVLRSGGVLVLSTPNLRYLKHLVSLFLFARFPRTSSDREAYDGGHIHYFASGNLRQMLREHGFRVTSVGGILGSRRAQFLRPLLRIPLVADIISAGLLIAAEKQSRC